MRLLKLVLVDDEPILLEGLLKTYDWEAMGFEVAASARSGEEAIRVIRETRPHVVLTDIRMKQISGLMVMEEVEKEGIDSLFIVLSAYRDFEYAQQACDLGAFAYLLKPIEDEKHPQDFYMTRSAREKITELAKSKTSGVVINRERVQGGILQAYRQKESGMLIFTMVPNSVLYNRLNQILLVLAGIYLLVILIAVGVSLYISRIFTKPIQKISLAMESFDGKDFSHKIELRTNTELDKIGHSYNEMLGNIEQLLIEIKNQEKELRTSELNMLISQINPHFLYNTLDTIYMLARISGEETTMRMIQALSRYLRLSLSKGRDIVTVEDELENVKSYMQIQQIRNENLFRYKINCEVEAKERQILKLILQPLVENAIKYGFCDILEGGFIRIEVREISGRLTVSVFNSGTPMSRETAEKLNALGEIPIPEMKRYFPDRQHGYGVVNIITRLRLKYGEDVRFEYETGEDGTTCVIRLPESKEEDNEL